MSTQLADKKILSEGGLQAFDRTLAAIKTSPPRGSIFIKAIRLTQFCRGINQILALCQQYHLRLEYYSNDNLLALQTMPSAIHDSIQSWIEWEIRRMIKEGFLKPSHWFNYISRNYSMGKYNPLTN